jgi:hypothetical protein
MGRVTSLVHFNWPIPGVFVVSIGAVVAFDGGFGASDYGGNERGNSLPERRKSHGV